MAVGRGSLNYTTVVDPGKTASECIDILIKHGAKKVGMSVGEHRLEESPGRCQGYRYNHMPLKAVYAGKRNNRKPTGIEPYRCKSPAWWHFDALPGGRTQTGDFCWSHLLVQTHSMSEQGRTRQALQLILAREREVAQ